MSWRVGNDVCKPNTIVECVVIPSRDKLFGKPVNSPKMFWLAAACFLVAAIIDLAGDELWLVGMFAAVATAIQISEQNRGDKIHP